MAADRRPRPRRVPLRLRAVPRLASAVAVVDALPHAGARGRRRRRARRRQWLLRRAADGGAVRGLRGRVVRRRPRVRRTRGPTRRGRAARLPAYGLMFHELSSEPVFAAAFALWALLVVRAAER